VLDQKNVTSIDVNTNVLIDDGFCNTAHVWIGVNGVQDGPTRVKVICCYVANTDIQRMVFRNFEAISTREECRQFIV